MLIAARPKGDVDDPQMWPAYRQIWPHLRPSQAELDPQRAGPRPADRPRALSPAARRPGAGARGGRGRLRSAWDRGWPRRPIRRSPGRCGSSCTGCSSTRRTSCVTWGGSRSRGRWTRAVTARPARAARGGASAHPAEPRQPGRRPQGARQVPGGARARPGHLRFLGGEQRVRRRLRGHAAGRRITWRCPA